MQIFLQSPMINKISTEMLTQFFKNVPTIWNINQRRMAAFQVKSTIATITKQHAVLKIQKRQELQVGTLSLTKK